MTEKWIQRGGYTVCAVHGRSICNECGGKPPLVGRYGPEGRLPAGDASSVASPSKPLPYSGKHGEREKFSKMATDGACPRCGGTNFKAKRSFGGKLAAGTAGVVALGVAPIGVAAAALVPKHQVKCVTCGLVFKRG